MKHLTRARGGWLPWSLRSFIDARHELRSPWILPFFLAYSQKFKQRMLAIMNLSLLWAALVDPSKMMSMALSLVDYATSVKSQESSFYPPLESISFITNSSYGNYGGHYTAPADDASPVASRSYNYCTMPHPFPDSYQPPSPVQNKSVQAQLVYVEYVQRHQRRTAYNILPGGEVRLYFRFSIEGPELNNAAPTIQLRCRSPISLYGIW